MCIPCVIMIKYSTRRTREREREREREVGEWGGEGMQITSKNTINVLL